MQVYFSIKGSEGRSSLYSWLHRIVVSKCYEFLRKKRLTVSYETSWEHSYGTARMQMPLDPYPTASSGCMRRLRCARVDCIHCFERLVGQAHRHHSGQYSGAEFSDKTLGLI